MKFEDGDVDFGAELALGSEFGADVKELNSTSTAKLKPRPPRRTEQSEVVQVQRRERVDSLSPISSLTSFANS